VRALFLIGTILLIISNNPLAQGATPSSSGVTAEELAEVKQNKTRNKIWGNLLVWYQDARKLAVTTQQSLNGISDMAWASYKQLAAIEQVAKKAQVVYENIESMDWKTMAKNPEKLIIYTEEQVFQKSDQLFFQDIPAFKQSSKELNDARINMQTILKSNVSGSKNLITQSYKVSRDIADATGKAAVVAYANTVGMLSPAGSGEWKKESARKAAQTHSRLVAVTAQATLKTEATALQTETQQAVLAGGLRKAQQDDQNPAGISEANKVNARNALITTVEKHDIVGNSVTTFSYMLLSELKTFDQQVVEKTLLMNGLVQLSEAMIEARKNAEEKK